MNAIILDVETTGLHADEGDRIVEIGMVEIDSQRLIRTGRIFHKYLNPQRSMSSEAEKIHGLTNEFLSDKPTFADTAEEFLQFIDDSRLMAHNSEFDLGFVNAELRLAGRDEIPSGRVDDTLLMARRELPKLARHSLDALCRHFGIDSSARQKHGALLDAELLADVFFRLSGTELDIFSGLDPSGGDSAASVQPFARPAAKRPQPLAPLISDAEAAAHEKMVASLGENALWHRLR